MDDELVPGAWYLCGVCALCEHDVPIMRIEPDAPVEEPVGGLLFPRVRCRTCGDVADYPFRDVARVQLT